MKDYLKLFCCFIFGVSFAIILVKSTDYEYGHSNIMESNGELYHFSLRNDGNKAMMERGSKIKLGTTFKNNDIIYEVEKVHPEKIYLIKKEEK